MHSDEEEDEDGMETSDTEPAAGGSASRPPRDENDEFNFADYDNEGKQLFFIKFLLTK